MFVVTLPSSAAKDPKMFARNAKRAGADILEIRTDLTPDVTKFSSPLPILLAVRGTDHRLVKHIQPAYIDVETQNFASLPRKAKLILSFHDYESTPSFAALKNIVLRMTRQKPWAIKIATFVKTYDDLLTLSQLQDWCGKTKQRSIVLGMGPIAHLSRVTSPLRNIFTYSMLDPQDAVASGQLPMSFYALTKGRKNPKIYGIFGGPHISASLSPLILNALFARHKIDALYSSFPSEDFSLAIKTLKKIGVQGLSVTAPFKQHAFHASSILEPLAEKLGVVNTLVQSGKKWKGCITDSYGIREGYPELTGVKTVAILGAGGALPSAILAIQERSPHACITVYARHTEKARRTLEKFAVTVDTLKNVAAVSADIVICAVSEDVSLPLPSPATKKSVAIDLRYGKVTHFMKDARAKKFRIHDGTNMLIYQALKQFKHFTGKAAYDDDAQFLGLIITSFLSSHGK